MMWPTVPAQQVRHGTLTTVSGSPQMGSPQMSTAQMSSPQAGSPQAGSTQVGAPQMMVGSSATYQTRGSPQAQSTAARPSAFSSRSALMRPSAAHRYQHPSLSKAPGQCEDECAEEECDPDRCGAENRPPRTDQMTCGVDTRPVLPVALATSTIIGALCMVLLQVPLACALLNLGEIAEVIVAGFISGLYVTTLACMAYCALCDPGQLTAAQAGQQDSGFMDVEAQQAQQQKPLPKRAHMTWQYSRPIRRYDHYCRWVTNCIGLLNHREFVLMCSGLVLIAIVGAAADAALILELFHLGRLGVELVIITLHLVYSLVLLFLAGPILRIHLGLVSRNELAAEWKRNEFYVAETSKHGENTPVDDLSDDEFNTLFDHFVYDQKRNSFDKGAVDNCWTFWCAPRWKQAQLGDF
mmetsp:Transcript_8285/g.20913  ORF Transcript_8285/g.20913 Transcript_8285/m.20913 type:complete len:410 (+) Transcript_8285:151-1380(+)